MCDQIARYQHLIAAMYGNTDLKDFKFTQEQGAGLITICDKLINTVSTVHFKDVPRAKDILFRRFGIGRSQETLKSVASSHNISVERVRQIEAKFLRYMKSPSRSFMLKMFLAEFNLVDKPPPLPIDPIEVFRERVRNGEILLDEELSLIQLDELELSVRACQCLRGEDISTLAQLKQLTASQLMRLPGFGKRTLQEITTVIDELGVGLKDEPVTDL